MKAVTYCFALLLFCGLARAQDRIKLKTGDEVKCRVYKIANGKVIYKKMHNLKGPDLSYPKAEVEYIKYESGKVVFMDPKVKTKTAPKKKTVTRKK